MYQGPPESPGHNAVGPSWLYTTLDFQDEDCIHLLIEVEFSRESVTEHLESAIHTHSESLADPW